MNLIKYIFLLVFVSLLISCSSKEVTEEKNNYVFDKVEFDSVEVNQDLSQTIQEPNQELNSKNYFYIIQIGAFTNEKRAQTFAEKSRKMLNEEIIVSFSDKVNLYLVQLGKIFNDKSEAEIVRNNLRLFPEFQGAWIITIIE